MIIINIHNCVIFSIVVAFKLALCNEILDISNPDHQRIFEAVTESNQLYSKITFCPRAGLVVKSVKDSVPNQTLWDGQTSGGDLNLVDIYTLNGNKKIALLSTFYPDGYRSSYFENVNYSWNEIPLNRFYSLLDQIKNSVIFDLLNPFEEENYDLEINYTSGLAEWVLTPKDNIYVHQVKQANQIIWQRENFEDKCFKIIFHGDTQTSKLVNVNLRRGQEGSQLFFEKKDDGWQPVEKEQFYQKLNQLDAEALAEIADEFDEEIP
ncbi:hypothetical protein TpMuguga_02g00215 [Theileria parva strain Muguga]|uniref:Uncharacterized protein n=1 Tax=Theileria parva TaxID=5875 RepID=Q4N5S5_THEPA|nr:uncharacterized protein TpMuguga_02g00215 [Theileria parva strain Muguga]EAN32498.1 hypothetical protein TpMuguga_02g00215 [Theileria parva strain Muguga]|eukprot:XP_764781.1 hypothetical protein [Theileria parva strain Muguga]